MHNLLFGGSVGRSYRDLVAWQKAMKFVTAIYEVTQRFPSEERYGLTNQLRRASVSVPRNISEGEAPFFPKEVHHFFSIALWALLPAGAPPLLSQKPKNHQTHQTRRL